MDKSEGVHNIFQVSEESDCLLFFETANKVEFWATYISIAQPLLKSMIFLSITTRPIYFKLYMENPDMVCFSLQEEVVQNMMWCASNRWKEKNRVAVQYLCEPL